MQVQELELMTDFADLAGFQLELLAFASSSLFSFVMSLPSWLGSQAPARYAEFFIPDGSVEGGIGPKLLDQGRNVGHLSFAGIYLYDGQLIENTYFNRSSGGYNPTS
jgi:hypothetical protein